MVLESLEDDEKFVLYLSLGILGAILLGAFLLILMDGWIFAYDERYNDGEDDEEFRYIGDTMMQPSSRNGFQQVPQQVRVQVQQQQHTQQAPQPAPPKQISVGKSPIQEQPLTPEPARLPAPPSQASVKELEKQANKEIQKATKAQAKLQAQAQDEIEQQQAPTSGTSLDIVPAQTSGSTLTAEQQSASRQSSKKKVRVNNAKTTTDEAAPTPPQIEPSSDDQEEPEANENSKHGKGGGLGVTGTVVPRMERIPVARFVFLSVLISLPTGIYVMYFTAMGWGETTFYWFTENFGEYASAAGGATAFFLALLYLLDANFWESRWIKQVCLEILVIGTVFTVLLLTGDYPYGPICCFAAITPLWMITCNQMLCCKGKIRTRDYVSSLSGPLFFISILTLGGFLGWTFQSDHHQYNRVTKVAFSQATGCVPNLADYPECAVDYTPPPPTPSPVATTMAPTFADELANNNTRYRVLHVVPAWANHEPHDDDTSTASAGEDGETEPPRIPLTHVYKLNEEDDKNVYTAEETGVCFDTVVSPPAFWLQEGCDPDCPDDLYNDCLNAFILWAGPLLCSMVLFFLSFFCTFLKGEDAEKDILNFGKLWLFLLFSMWLTASLAGVASGLSSALVAMTLASFVGSIVFVATTRSKEESKEQGAQIWNRIEENYGAYMDVARGLFLVTCTPFIFLYFIFSILNQFIRKLGLPCSKPLKTPQQKADFVTKRTRGQINSFLSWDRAKVLTYAIYWGIAFMILQVIVSQFTVLFLSWLIEFTSTLNLGVVTAILVFVGMVMFLLPPVPGVPIYLTLGIVILAVGQETLGLYGAMAYAATASLLLKLLACTVQQKLIGESLAGSISVRKLVGINSSLIKAMRLVLAQPGMGFDKVCILVGGPDWPTSVLCGIMGLDLIPILIGTLPVFALILPTMLTGSFTYMAGLKDPDTGELEYPSAAVLATVFAAVTALVQFAAMILAAYYLEQTTSNRAEELAAIPDDKEVAELEAAEVELNESYTRVTQWDVVPGFMKLVLYVAFALIVASCYMVMFFAHLCFADYALTYTIDEHLGGKWYNLVLPVGWVAILLFCASCLILTVFTSWAGGKAKKELANAPPASEQPVSEQPADASTRDDMVTTIVPGGVVVAAAGMAALP